MTANNAPENIPYDFPPLPLEEWEKTKETLHLYIQIIGKIRLALMPRRNHWWNVTLYVTSRGLSTSPIPYNFYSFEIDFDFVDHQLMIRTSTGAVESLPLQDGLSVSQFYTSVMKALEVLGVHVEIRATPYDLKDNTPFAQDHLHASYDPEQVNRYWRVLVTVDQVLKEFSGRFYGKACPVHLYWHHLDLVVTRFSGRSIPVRDEASVVEKDAYSHEVISFGFWPGDDQVRYPAFYSYTFPSPDGIELEKLRPRQAQWVDSNGSPMALLNYEELRQLDNPRAALLDFLESAYTAGANLANWPVEELRAIPLDEL
ncbi:MAG: DUF5996 family protein [Hymenobacteraceae bacterium]|nr:DUF5996 family protein [Hymenobacteraceae bacterium]MDX5481488.1 DUF5996 family protein [Hymenobacteraceae bacterium]